MAKTCHKSIRQWPLRGTLDAHTPIGNANPNDFRVVLNTSMDQQDKLSRRPGWQGLNKDPTCFWGKASAPCCRGNWDLHDQLLALADNTVTTPKREAINLHFQAQSDCNAYCMVACTRSRIYADTGSSANWRILADNLGQLNQDRDEYEPFGSTRWMAAQGGNFVLFTNDYNPVLAWPIGGAPDPDHDDPYYYGDECTKAQAAKPIVQLEEIGIIRAGVVASWSGFIFLADVETGSARECETIYWSDFNSPLDWVHEVNSAAGFVSLSRGEKVLRMEPLAGQLRVYTTQAIYSVTLVGGDEVFRFIEVYRGPDALAYRFGFANLGDSHVYLTNSGLVELRLWDATPNRIEWVHKASGVITRGLDGRLLRDYPGPFTGFQGLDPDRCNQVTAGYDKCRREVWFSWPTMDADETDSEGVKRMSLVISRLYQHASIVDHGFSSFCNFVPRVSTSVRDWMVMIGACSPEEIDSFAPRYCKEGTPFNEPIYPPPIIPDHIINPGEDWTAPASDNSICALYGDMDIITLCGPCNDPCRFSMASLKDFCLKEQDDRLRLREVYVGSGVSTP
jgi:hypothetical protein